MTLDQVKKGSEFKILEVPDGPGRSQLIRLGIVEGASLICAEKFQSGPVILRSNRQEIAIGHQLARGIVVSTNTICPAVPGSGGLMDRMMGRKGSRSRNEGRGKE